jgi:hypothetical protein
MNVCQFCLLRHRPRRGFHNGPDYCCGLETDKQGNFYYTKCFNPTDQGGTVLKVSANGEKIEVFATGLWDIYLTVPTMRRNNVIDFSWE